MNRYIWLTAVLMIATQSSYAEYRDIYIKVYSCPSKEVPIETCVDPGVPTPIPGFPDAQIHPFDVAFRKFSSISASRDVIWEPTFNGRIVPTNIYNDSLEISAGRDIRIDAIVSQESGIKSEEVIKLNAAGTVSGVINAHDATGTTWTVVMKPTQKSTLITSTPDGVRICRSGTLGCYVSLETVEKLMTTTIALVDGTRDAIIEYVKSNGDKISFLQSMGERITTGLSGSLTRVMGLINTIGTGLLETDVAIGVREIWRAVNDPNSITNGLYGDATKRRNLEDAYLSIDSQEIPLKPTSTSGGQSTFSVPVTRGTPVILDPLPATGFEYRTDGSGPLFDSFALPLIEGEVVMFEVEALDNGEWKSLGLIPSLQEVFFDDPVTAFRVNGIPLDSGITDENHESWFTMVSFDRDGVFNGTMIAQTDHDGEDPTVPGDPIEVSEPGSLALSVFALCLVFVMRRRGIS